MGKTPHVIERREVAADRRQQLFEQLFSMPLTNKKWLRSELAFPFDEKCAAFVAELAASVLNDSGGTLREFLKENPWPPEFSDLCLTDQERARFVVMNALKVWVSKEMNYLDTLFTGGQFRKKLRAMAAGRKCPGCTDELSCEAEFHHTVRDGRPPLPVCKDCHRKLETKKRATHLIADESGRASVVKDIRRSTNASWSNLVKAARALEGLPYAPFSTKGVEGSSKSIVRRMLKETGIGLGELLRVLEQAMPKTATE